MGEEVELPGFAAPDETIKVELMQTIQRKNKKKQANKFAP